MFANSLRAGLLATTLLASGWAHAHDTAVATELKQFGRVPHAAATQWPDSPAPLWGNLGSLHFPITTESADGPRYFNEGLALTYGFNHAEARRSFRTAQSLDPQCAMCLDIAVLYAEALMDLTPWNYWADGGKTGAGTHAGDRGDAGACARG